MYHQGRRESLAGYGAEKNFNLSCNISEWPFLVNYTKEFSLFFQLHLNLYS